jgi:hypothetical protein
MSRCDPTRSNRIRGPWVRALVLVAALAGCGRASEGPAGDAFGADAAASETLDVTIENQNFYDATVTALWEGGSRERIGSVTGLTTQTFTLEPRSDAVRFEIDFLAGGDFVGELIAANPGDHIELTLRP